MKICIVGLKNLNEPGGIETHVKYVAKYLAKKAKVYLIVNSDNKVRIPGVKIIKVPYIKNRYLTKLSMAISSIRAINKIKPDVIYANDAVYGFLTSLLFKNVVYVAHGVGYLRPDWPGPVKLILKFFERFAFNHAKVILAVDKKTYLHVKKHTTKPVYQIYNGVDITEFNKRYRRPKEYKEKIIVTFVGRLIKSKGIYDAIEIFSKIKNPNVGLYIIGKGPEEDKVKKLASKYKNIHFVGYVKNVIPYLKYSDIFIMPSYYEGLPIVLLEAMAAKNACISYDFGDIKERFGDNIIIVKKGDKKAFYKELLKLLKNKQITKKIIAKSYGIIKTEYSWKVISVRIYNLLKSI